MTDEAMDGSAGQGEAGARRPAGQAGRRITARDWHRLAELVLDERARRRDDAGRVHLEKMWKEVDRQVRMEPKPRTDAETRGPPGSEWMPELELPLQAQALEVLTADARRLMFPSDRDWFQAEAVVTDDYLASAEAVAAVYGDRAEIPSRITQEDANALAEAAILHFEGQYDFRRQVDRMNAEAFKYGTFVGRVGLVRRDVVATVPGGVRRDSDLIPALVPQSVREVYLDPAWQAAMHEGLYVQPSFIRCYSQRVDDLKLAAGKGERDPEKPNGGWMPGQLAGLETPTRRTVDLVEFEGDLVLPRSAGEALFVANVVVTVADGAAGRTGNRVVRLRYRDRPWRSYVVGAYHLEDARSPYGTSPLMKGYPIQTAATEALCRLVQAGALDVGPPVWMNPADYRYDVDLPRIAPYEIWRTLTKPEVVAVGNPAGLLQVYLGYLKQYEDLTGVSAPRLGAQTKSHTTAFAVDAEITRGLVRTVDYVSATLDGPLGELLMRLYDLARDAFPERRPVPVWVERLNGFVGMTRALLPPAAKFWAQGTGAPLEERDKQQKRLAALTTVLKIEPLVMQAGGTPVDLDRLRADILKEGGIVDVERYIPPRSVAAVAGGAAPGMPRAAAAAAPGQGVPAADGPPVAGQAMATAGLAPGR